MNFDIGETVMYPRHGAAVIEKIYQRKIRDNEMTFLTLKCKDGLTIDVPADNVEMVGVRDVVDNEGLDRIFEVLRAQHTEEPTNWSRRFKANTEKIASGDMIKVAEVVRDLTRRDLAKGLSNGEKRALTEARKLLIGELALANNSGADAANELLDSVLAS